MDTIGNVTKGAIGKEEEGPKKKRVSKSKKAGLIFPVGRIGRFLKRGMYAKRVGTGAPIYMAAVLEYLVAELLELSGNAARDNKKIMITPRHILLAVKSDAELDTFLRRVTIAHAGVRPHINPMLLKKKAKKKVSKKPEKKIEKS